MNFSCPHCEQRLEADPDAVGLTVQCPNCGLPFVVAPLTGENPSPDAPRPPAPRPVAPIRRPPVGKTAVATKPVSAGGGGKTFLALVLLAVAGFGGVMAWFQESPLQTWHRLAGYATALVHPAGKPASAPVPKPTLPPAATPAPTTPTPTPLPAVMPTPPPTPPDPLAWLQAHKARWPKEVVLLVPVEFPDVFNGRVVGSTVMPVGSSVTLAEIGPAQITVRRFQGTKSIAATATNLSRLAELEMARPEPTPSPEIAAATSPEPTPPPEENAPLAAPGQKGGEPRVYVGSAYQPAITDMATKPDDWKNVRAAAGFHEHPVGWHPAYASWGLGQKLLSAYQQRYFTAEEDIGGLAHGGSGTHWAHTVIEQGNRYGQSWRCVAITVNFAASRLLKDPPKAAQDLQTFCKDATGLRMPYYLLFSPVSPDAVSVFDQMNKPYENQPVWVWIAQHAGAAGVAIDCPATFISNPRWRQRGVEIYQTTHRAGLKFIWMFNGGTDASVTEHAAQALRGLQVRPDYWIVSHFHDSKYPGTPENKNGTVTSQASVLIRGNF